MLKDCFFIANVTNNKFTGGLKNLITLSIKEVRGNSRASNSIQIHNFIFFIQIQFIQYQINLAHTIVPFHFYDAAGAHGDARALGKLEVMQVYCRKGLCTLVTKAVDPRWRVVKD